MFAASAIFPSKPMIMELTHQINSEKRSKKWRVNHEVLWVFLTTAVIYPTLWLSTSLTESIYFHFNHSDALAELLCLSSHLVMVYAHTRTLWQKRRYAVMVCRYAVKSCRGQNMVNWLSRLLWWLPLLFKFHPFHFLSWKTCFKK